MQPIKSTCITCGNEFWIIPQEQKFLKQMNLPFPINCPSCRQERRLKDRGERRLYKTSCQNCHKDTIVSYNPGKETRKILCKECYLDYFEKNPVLVSN